MAKNFKSFSIPLAIGAVAAYICLPSSAVLAIDFSVSSTSSNLSGTNSVNYYGQSFNTSDLGDGSGIVGGPPVYLQSWSVAVDGVDYSSEPIYIHDSVLTEASQIETGFLGTVSSSTAVADPDFNPFTTYQWDFSSLDGGNGLELQPGVEYYAFWGDGSMPGQIRASSTNPYGGGIAYQSTNSSITPVSSVDIAFKAEFDNTSASVPFEFSPGTGILLLSSLFGLNWTRKKLGSKNKILN